MRKKHQVRVGQVYQAVAAASGRSWRVKDVLTLFGIPHVRVVSSDNEGDIKTLSCLVLADTSYYRMIEEAPAAA
ncbi:MAG TPA: hypothetical protein VD978_06320 [Azospirillum sp.]|nr:hypothetical protein [Azospirillum sp.]